MGDARTELDAHLRRIAYRNGRGAALFVAVFIAVLWPTDLVVFRHMPGTQHVINVLRLTTILIALAGHLVMRSAIGRRRPTAVLGVGGVLILFAVGWGFGELGGPDTPFIHLAWPALFFSVLAPVPLGTRAVLVFALWLALVGGIFGMHPRYLDTPYATLALSFGASLAVLAIAVGNVSFRIMRQSFYQSRLTAHLERAREEERTRIARDVHDQLGQELTAIHLALSLAQQRFTKDPKSIERNLDELRLLLQRTQSTARNLITELRPQLLDELGLVAGIEWLMRQAEERAPLKCTLTADGVDDLPRDVAVAAFRIAQEALTNVVRHARARTVAIALTVREKRLALHVADDGVGLRGDAEARPAGFGLIGIRERVAARFGTMELGARAGGGTELAVSLPIVNAEEESS